VALYNDLASLKKELKADEVDNIIPILVYHHNISAQDAVNMTIKMLEESYKSFNAAVERLERAVDAESKEVKRDVEILVDACVDLLVGNVAWSLATRRYLPRTAFSDGSSGFEVVL
jgi:type II secretory pathway predicted ATPase ExeA